MKLKGIELEGAYKVVYYTTSFKVYDEKGNMIYYQINYENGSSFWTKWEYNGKGNMIYSECSNGYWYKNEYNEKGKRIYFEDSNGDWYKNEYNEKGKRIYFEDSNGKVIDKRVKELTIEEIEKLLGYKITIKEGKNEQI